MNEPTCLANARSRRLPRSIDFFNFNLSIILAAKSCPRNHLLACPTLSLAKSLRFTLRNNRDGGQETNALVSALNMKLAKCRWLSKSGMGMSHRGECPALPCPALLAALASKTDRVIPPSPAHRPHAPPWHLAHAGATECMGSGEKGPDHISPAGTNSDVAAPSPRG